MCLPRDVMVNGTNPLLLLDELRALGTATVAPLTDDIPPLEEIDPTACYLGWEVTFRRPQPRSAPSRTSSCSSATRWSSKSSRSMPRRRAGHGESRRPAAAAPVASPLDRRQQPAGRQLVKPPERQPPRQGQRAAGAAEQQATAAARSAKSAPPRSIRVPAERLDELMNRVGELVIAQSRLRQIATASTDQQMTSVAEEIERLVLELRDTTMGIRMVPIGSLFGRFRRVVHDLSRDLGKQVELAMEGEETELDKTVIEQLNDPLVHLIRNAIDHGLEDPDGAHRGRQAARSGASSLSARHAGTEVLITITDDGRGLNRERIRARAEERGLICRRRGASPTTNCSRCCSSPASRPRRRSPAFPAAASAWTWSSAPSRRCAARSTSPARPARAPRSRCACR